VKAKTLLEQANEELLLVASCNSKKLNCIAYFCPKGQVVARQVSGQTSDAQWALVGREQQGLRMLDENKWG